MAELKTKGYTYHFDRNFCEDCVFIKWIGKGLADPIPFCSKLEPHFLIAPEDVCDEYEEEN